MKKKWVFIVVSVVFIAFTQCYAGTENLKGDTAVVVQDDMVVTSSRILEKKETISTNITVYNQGDLEQLSSDDLSDLLLKEGFMVREYPNSTISVGIRGFRTETHGNDLASYVLVLIDGRRAGTGNIAKISLDNVERVEIIHGPGSVQYGASAMGGVINVITQKGQKGFHGSVEGSLGSWDYKKMQANLSGSQGSFDFSLSASKASQGDYDTGNGDRYANTGYDAKDKIDLNAGYTFLPNNRVGVTLSSYEGNKIGSPSYLSNVDVDNYVDHSLKAFDIYYDGQTPDGFLLWKLRYFNGKDEYETFDPSTSSEHSYFRDTDHQGVQAQITAKWDMVHLTGGIDWTDYGIVNTYSTDGQESSYDNPAAFLLAKTFLLEDKLILSAGGRYDKYEVESDTGKSKNENNWAMSLGAVYKLPAGFSVRVNYAEAFRMPTADELYMYTDYSAWGMGIWSGNEDLDPESSKTYEAGIDYTNQGFTAGLTFFHTDFKNKISYAYDAITGVTIYDNVEGATYEGFEGSLQYNIGEHLGWQSELIPYVSFTVMTQYEDESTGEDLQYVQDWDASWGVQFNNQGWGLTSRLNFTYYGDQDITDYEKTGATSLGKDMVVDISFSKTLCSLEKYGEIALKGDITNLFDRDYALVQGYTAPGRTFYLGLNYTF